MSIPVVETFFALQGEGDRMGTPSVFVRLGGCTLTCKGFGCIEKSPIDNSNITGCDSIHAVSVKHFKHTWKYLDSGLNLIQLINENICTTPNGNSEKVDIVFTGGEPLIHHKDSVLLDTLEYFISRGHKIYFETNGTVDIDFHLYDIYKKVSFSMSVKMSNSGEELHKRWKPEVVNNYLRNTSGSYFKFVLSEKSIESNSTEIFDFLKQVPTFGIVYCMPLGETMGELESNAKAVYEYCLTHGFRYSDRLHIRIYNNLRGV